MRRLAAAAMAALVLSGCGGTPAGPEISSRDAASRCQDEVNRRAGYGWAHTEPGPKRSGKWVISGYLDRGDGLGPYDVECKVDVYSGAISDVYISDEGAY